jgi:hypothetical protein|tara:strand:+ start:1679 stop:1840 length:162 start_codon:yes stop_codon:yes gene_type:complete
MKTRDELREMELGDLMDHLIEAEDTIKYCSYSRRDLDYLRALRYEFERRQQII